MHWPRWAADLWSRFFPPRPLGWRGERAAARFLRRRGYTILAHSDRSPLGEIDLVAVDGRTVVFVEVKTRQSAEDGHPAEFVDHTKQIHMTRAALAWLKRHRLLDHSARFDVVAVLWPDGARRPQIEHIPNAFEAAGTSGFHS